MRVEYTLRTLALFLLLCFVSCSPRDDTSQPPEMQKLRNSLPVQKGLNVIVISFDALRPDFLGIYGGDRGVSPNIDAFGEKSLVFDHAYSAAPVTPTSFAAAFSGMLPARVFHAWDFVAEDTLAKRFSEAGYKTLGFFNSVQMAPERNFDRGFDVYDWQRSGPDEDFLDRVTAGLVDHLAAQPMFAWIHFLLPHAPYDYRELAKDFYDSDYDGPFLESTGGRFEVETPEDAERVRSLYDGQVFYADFLFGKLIHRLGNMGLMDDTVIVLTSDHGEEFHDHGGYQHGSKLFEEAVRIPLLAYHPKVANGQRTDVVYNNVDLMPTLLNLVGFPVDASLDGKDLLSQSRNPQFSVSIAMTGQGEHNLSLRNEAEKLILYCLPEEKVELYDLENDPKEHRDIAAQKEKVTFKLKRLLGKILGGDPCEVTRSAVRGEVQTRGMDEESIEALKALGYL